MMRIGIFGGTFDPIHWGHLQLAQSAAKEIPLDRIYFVPAKQSPFKKKVKTASAKDRVQMLMLAIEEHPKFSLSDFELKRPAPSFSIHTIRFFRRQFPGSELYFILGTDSLENFKKWFRWKEILSHVTLVAGKRKQFTAKIPKDVLAKTWFLKSKMTEISSTEIRVWVKSEPYLSKLVPLSVARFIMKEGLYQ